MKSDTVNNTCLMAAFPEKPGQAGTKQVKQFWILIKQQIMGSADILPLLIMLLLLLLILAVFV